MITHFLIILNIQFNIKILITIPEYVLEGKMYQNIYYLKIKKIYKKSCNIHFCRLYNVYKLLNL